ncbi:hypothetical protein D9M73_143960 [compost metagenome]
MLVRSAPTTIHARSSLIPSAVWRCATASRFPAGVTIFESWSFRPALSSIVFVSSRLSRAFSSSSARSRFASDTSSPPELSLPCIIGRARHPVPPAQIRHYRTRLGLLQGADDLLFRKLLPLHLSVPSSGADSSSNCRKKWGARHSRHSSRRRQRRPSTDRGWGPNLPAPTIYLSGNQTMIAKCRENGVDLSHLVTTNAIRDRWALRHHHLDVIHFDDASDLGIAFNH